MILLDSNIVIDAMDRRSQFRDWAQKVIAEGLSSDGIALNAIVLAELCVGQHDPKAVEIELRRRGLTIVDVPASASSICGRAYTRYRSARRKSGGSLAPMIPLPDFFIGAHAEVVEWKLATRDVERYRLYFPKVDLITPEAKIA